MRSVKYLVAAGAASLLSSAAFAADMAIAPPPMQYAPPPVEEFGGWYLRGDIGFSNQNVKNVLDTNSAAYNNVAVSQTSSFSSAGIYGGLSALVVGQNGFTSIIFDLDASQLA